MKTAKRFTVRSTADTHRLKLSAVYLTAAATSSADFILTARATMSACLQALSAQERLITSVWKFSMNPKAQALAQSAVRIMSAVSQATVNRQTVLSTAPLQAAQSKVKGMSALLSVRSHHQSLIVVSQYQQSAAPRLSAVLSV